MIRTKLTAFCILLYFSFLSWNCTKIDTTTIGSGLIPAVDNVNTFELILPVVANNVDSVSKDCSTVYPLQEHALGAITNDPYFGTTKAIIYTELKPDFFPFKFQGISSERTLDSVVLVLSYKRTFGDTLSMQQVSVHEISGVFKPDTSSCSVYRYNSDIIGSASFIPAKLSDSIIGFMERSKNELRIKLSNTFGQNFLTKDSTNFKTDSSFKEAFRGFAIVPENMGNALTYYNLADSNTKLAFYFKYKRAGLSDTAVVTNLRFNPQSASANNVVRNHAGAEINNYLNNSPAGNDFVYIQTTPGTYAELKIPGLTGLSNRIIHRAELILEQVYSPSSLDNFFTPPNYLFLDLKDSMVPVPCDFTLINGQPDLSAFGGFKTIVKDPFGNNIARYSFNISRYIQKIVTTGRTNSTLRLRAPDYEVTSKAYINECGLFIPKLNFALNPIAFGRVKLGGGTNPDYRLRLKITYSNL